jgi:hypothetical protein
MENSQNKELERLLNEAYYDLDYGMSHNAKLKKEDIKYLNQSMDWIKQALAIIKNSQNSVDKPD